MSECSAYVSYWSFIAASLAFRSLTHFEIIFVYDVREYSHFKVHENMLDIIIISESGNEVAQSCPTHCDPWTVAHQAPPSMRFSRQEYWRGLPFPSPRGLPHPGIEPRSPTLQADALTSANFLI